MEVAMRKKIRRIFTILGTTDFYHNSLWEPHGCHAAGFFLCCRLF